MIQAVLLLALAAPDARPSALYFHDAIGLGAWVATSQYRNSTDPSGPPGTRDIQGFSISAVATLGFRATDAFAIGAQVHAGLMPWVNGTENRSRGFRPLPGIPYGLHLATGPVFVLLPGALRFDLSPGLVMVLTGPEGGGRTPAFGGYGGGLSAAVGYDVPMTDAVALALELRLTTGVHVNADATHLQGFDFGIAFLAGVRRR